MNILERVPGGDIRFEGAAFKSHIGGSGTRRKKQIEFEGLTCDS